MSDTPTITAKGVISLQTIAMPADTNWNGDIFGGWLMAQMDLAGAVAARKRAHGRITTVAVESMIFLHPVKIGDVLSCYTNIERVGNTSMKIRIEVWETAPAGPSSSSPKVFILTWPSTRTASPARYPPKPARPDLLKVSHKKKCPSHELFLHKTKYRANPRSFPLDGILIGRQNRHQQL